MSTSLRIFALVLITIYFVIIFSLLKKKKFALKYSLLWFLAGILMARCRDCFYYLLVQLISFASSYLRVLGHLSYSRTMIGKNKGNQCLR